MGGFISTDGIIEKEIMRELKQGWLNKILILETRSMIS